MDADFQQPGLELGNYNSYEQPGSYPILGTNNNIPESAIRPATYDIFKANRLPTTGPRLFYPPDPSASGRKVIEAAAPTGCDDCRKLLLLLVVFALLIGGIVLIVTLISLNKKETKCTNSPCQHSGTCVDAINGYNCTCAAGYTGSNCETDIDECAASACQHCGTCLDGINGYTCSCASGYTGLNCETGLFVGQIPVCNTTATSTQVAAYSYTATSGSIYSPNYPCNYCNYLALTYNIQPTVSSTVTLTFVAFNTETDYDKLIVTSGSTKSPVYSGSTLPAQLSFTSTTSVSIQFTADSANNFSGFNITYTIT